MLAGIFSDTHDNLAQIARAIEVFRQRQVAVVLHAGDIVSPFAARAIAEIKVPLHIILGNNEGEMDGLRKVLPQLTHGPVEINLQKCLVAMAHDFPQIPQEWRERVDVLVAGHTHQAFVEVREGKLWVNPGETCGWVTGRSTVAVLDTETRTAEIIELPMSKGI